MIKYFLVPSPKHNTSIPSGSVNSIETIDERHDTSNQMSKEAISATESRLVEKPGLVHFKVCPSYLFRRLFVKLTRKVPGMVVVAPCQEAVLTGDEVDLSLLPIWTCWPNEPTPLITWSIAVTKGPTEDKQDSFNFGIYRMQLVNLKMYVSAYDIKLLIHVFF